MRGMPVSRTAFSCLLAALPLLPACASAPSTAGSIAVPAGTTRTLHVRATEPRELRLHLWNRGAGTVQVTPVAPLALEPASSVLQPNAGDLRWQVTATTLSIELTGGQGDTTVGYELHANGKVTVDVDYE